ncbi:hypothetical protein RCL1_003819 [Eukaryota sp. TZLM3-RCL]
MFFFKALYDFESTAENELSIVAGDILCSDTELKDDDWFSCFLYSHPEKRGFVPPTFISPISEPESLNTHSSPPHSSPFASSPRLVSSPRSPKSVLSAKTATMVSDILSRSERFSKSLLAKSPNLNSSRVLKTPSASLLSTTRQRLRDTQHRMKSRATPSSSDDLYQEMHQKHETLYKEICSGRDALFSELERLATDAVEKTRTAKSHVQKAVDYLMEIETFLTEEQQRLGVVNDVVVGDVESSPFLSFDSPLSSRGGDLSVLQLES